MKMELSDCQEIEIEDESTKRFCEQTDSFKAGFCMIEPYNQIHMKGYKEFFHEALQQFEVLKDDVWICTFPKSGK